MEEKGTIPSLELVDLLAILEEMVQASSTVVVATLMEEKETILLLVLARAVMGE